MNQSNLKQVLSVVATAIAAKFAADRQQMEKAYEIESEKIGKDHVKALTAAYVKIKAAPIAKIITVDWRDKIDPNYPRHSYSTDLTPWAKAVLDEVQTRTNDKVEALRENCGSFSVRLDFGTNDRDNVDVRVPNVKRGAFDALKSEYDRMRLTLLLSDDETALTVVTQFLARIREL